MQLYTYKATSNADADLIQAIQQTGQRCWDQGLPNGDVRPIAEAYSGQAKFYQPHGGLYEGRAAITALWQAAIDNGLRHVAFETHEVEQVGTLAYETGSYSILNEEGNPRESGYYVAIWRKENGEWKWHRSIYNYYFRADS